MREELESTVKTNSMLASERERSTKEIEKLEEDIKETIEIYTKMIVQMKDSQSDDTALKYGGIHNRT